MPPKASLLNLTNMKKLTITAMATGAFFLLTSSQSVAQSKARPSAWGSWQLVSNVATPRSASVQFYNSEGVLMYEERVEGRRLNPARRKVCRQLDDALAVAYQSWKEDKTAALDGKNILARRSKAKTAACTSGSPH